MDHFKRLESEEPDSNYPCPNYCAHPDCILTNSKVPRGLVWDKAPRPRGRRATREPVSDPAANPSAA